MHGCMECRQRSKNPLYSMGYAPSERAPFSFSGRTRLECRARFARIGFSAFVIGSPPHSHGLRNNDAKALRSLRQGGK